jgi:GTPase SAR1 family protein
VVSYPAKPIRLIGILKPLRVRVKELNEKAPANIIITLVGNKIDLENRQVSQQEGEEYAKA